MTALLCYAILLLIPAATLMFGLRYQKSVPGADTGYPFVPATAEASAYAQKLAGGRYVLFSIVMLVCGIGFMLLMPYADTVSLLCCTGIALGLEVVVLLVGMTSVGMALQSHFKPAVN